MKLKYVMLVLLLIIIIPFAIYYIDKYKEKIAIQKEEKIQEVAKQKEKDNYYFTQYLRLEGDFVINGNKVQVSNLTCKETKLNILVYYYNCFNQNELTADLLLEEYNNFCKGLDEYDNLILYRTFLRQMYDLDISECSPEKIHVNVFYDACLNGINEQYGYLEDEERDEYLTKEDVYYICNKVMEDNYQLYLQDLADNLIYSYYHLTDEYNSNYELIESNGQYMSIAGDCELYYSERNNRYSGKEELYLTKIVYLKSGGVGYAKIGEDYSVVKSQIMDGLPGVELTVETEDRLEFEMGPVLVVAKFDSSATCTEMSIEITQ